MITAKYHFDKYLYNREQKQAERNQDANVSKTKNQGNEINMNY